MTRFMLFCMVAICPTMVLGALSPPQDDPVLWVTGKVTQANYDQGVAFDMTMVGRLQQGSIKTNNHVVDQIVEYRGPKLASLLDYVGAQGEMIKVIAWDDYVVTISRADISKYGVLLATHEAGKRMTIDDKGPFFIVFPFSDHVELRNDLYYSLSVWQVREIVVE